MTKCWERKPLGALADLCLGKMLDQKKNRGELMPYLANVNVRWGEFVLDDLRTMRFELKELDRYGLKFGDIVMCEGGEPGRCAIWKNQVPNMMIQKALHRIRPKDNLDYRFLFYNLLHVGQTKAFDQYSTGSTIKHLPGEKLSKVEVIVPPLRTQRRIASILSAYDDLIENNTRRIAILEEMARRIYEEWFVHFRFPGHEQVKMVESELGLIPEGWSIEKVASVAHRLPVGRTYKKESVAESGSVMVVDQSTSDHLGFHDLNVDHPASVNTPRIIFGDHTCKLKLMLRPFSVGPNTIPFLGTGGLDSIYVFQLVQGLVQTREYKRHWTDFSDKQVVLCETELASRYGDAVRNFFHLAQVLDDKNRTLRATRDLLLPKLMSGELDVSSLPEPEEVITA